MGATEPYTRPCPLLAGVRPVQCQSGSTGLDGMRAITSYVARVTYFFGRWFPPAYAKRAAGARYQGRKIAETAKKLHGQGPRRRSESGSGSTLENGQGA
jgi:hypothetical protein